jgi:uncharacterized protein (TIGR02246 family)
MSPGRSDAAIVSSGCRAAIEQLIHRHAWLIDHGQAEKVAELFTEDGALFGVGPDKTSRAAIAEWGRQRAARTERRSRHVHTNILIEAEGEDMARGTTILTLYRHDGDGEGSASPLVVGEFEDLFRKQSDGGWLFVERRLSILFGKAEQPAPAGLPRAE